MRGNRMGPEEQGAKTGRGLGYCNGNDEPGFMNEAPPMGMRRGIGNFRGNRGRGFGRRGFGMRGFGGRQPVFEASANREILDRLEKLEKAIEKLSGE